MQDEEVYDITVIGAGPVGLFGSFYAGLRGMKTKIIDALPQLGGQPQTLYPEKFIYDMPGYPQVLAADLIRNLVAQTMRFEPTVALDEKVVKLEKDDDGIITLSTAVNRRKAEAIGSDIATHRTKSVLIAAGAGSFSPNKPNIEDLDRFEGNGLHYYVQKRDIFKGKRLIIVGGGDSALDWAQNLEPLAASVMLVHRNDRFRAHEDSVQWLLRRSRIPTRLFWEVKGCEGDGCVQRVTIYNNKTKEEETVEVDALLLNLGFKADLGPLKELGLTIEKNRIVVDQYRQTNIPGVYSAGDICTYDGKLPLIATGVGEAATAVCFAKNYIDPKSTVDPGHSSHMALSPTTAVAGATGRDKAIH